MVGADDLEAALAGLRAEWSLDFRRVQPVLRRLACGGRATVTELIADSGLSRRNVEAVTAVLDPWLERDGDRLRLDPSTATVVTAAGRPPEEPDDSALAARLEAFAAGLPPSLWRLDHVPATPATMAARARYLATEYDLAGASVVCLGDHDLTSLALGLVEPGAEVAVVDVDERVLDHVVAVARAEGFPVTAAFADLRLGLPVSLAGTADLVFTDPPYSAEGVRLFLERGVEALRRHDHARVVFCYGYGDRHLVRGVEVQRVVDDLRLALEAVLPGFNRYRGAEAIGSCSNLYVCRPTTRTWDRAAAHKGRAGARIYSRGGAAANAATPVLPDPVAGAVTAALAGAEATVVGPDGDVDVPSFAGRLATWATSPKPQPPPFGDVIAVDLHPHFGASLVRVLLLAVPARAVIVAPGRSLAAAGAFRPHDPLGRLLAGAYDVEVVRPAETPDAPAVVAATRHDRPAAGAGAAVLAVVVRHPGAKVGNAWREALVWWSRASGRPVTKNEARSRIAGAGVDPWILGLRTWELPLSALRAVVLAVEQDLAAVPAGAT